MSGKDAARGTAVHQILAEALEMTVDFGIRTHPRDYLGQVIHVEPSTEHPSHSPSSSDRWGHCAGSIQLAQVARKAGAVEEEQAYDIKLDEEDIIAATVAYDYVLDRLEEERDYSPFLFLELKVSPEKSLLTKDCDGTLDIFLKSKRVFEVMDYKHGRGVYVPEDTWQMELYMIGICDQFENDVIPQLGRRTIIQPRFPGSLAVRSLQIASLPNWLAERTIFFRRAYEATLEENAPLVPSEKACRFCDAAGICKPGQEFALSKMGIVDVMPDDGDTLYTQLVDFAAKSSQALTGAQMAALLSAKEVLLGALSSVEKAALQMIQHRSAPAEVLQAFKVIRGSAHRKWREDEDETFRLLKKIRILDPEKDKMRALGKKDLMETRLRSPAATERFLKLLGIHQTDARWNALQRLIECPEGALKLVPSDAPGEPIDIGTPPPPPDRTEESPNHGTLPGLDI